MDIAEYIKHLENQIKRLTKKCDKFEISLHATQERCWRVVSYYVLHPIRRDAEEYEKTHSVRVSILKGREQS